MNHCPSDLYDYMRLTHHMTGWIPILGRAIEIDNEDEEALRFMDDAWRANAARVEVAWKSDMESRCAHDRKDQITENPDMCISLRMIYLEDTLQDLRIAIRKAYRDYNDSEAMDLPIFGRLLDLYCSGVSELEKKERRMAKELSGLSGEPRGVEITEDALRVARSKPLESVLDDAPKRGFIRCPVHLERIGREDKHASMFVKNGYGYCFSCLGSLDAIGYLTKVKGLRFSEAIVRLQS